MIVGLGFFLSSCEARSESAPGWSLKDLSSKTVKLSDFKGKIVVLNFWATWCPPCVAEIPDFIDFEKKYQDKNVVVIGLSLDAIQPSAVAAFAKKNGMNYPIVMATSEVAEAYGADNGIPLTLFVAPDGTVAAKMLGIASPAYLEKNVQKLMRAGATK